MEKFSFKKVEKKKLKTIEETVRAREDTKKQEEKYKKEAMKRTAGSLVAGEVPNPEDENMFPEVKKLRKEISQLTEQAKLLKKQVSSLTTFESVFADMEKPGSLRGSLVALEKELREKEGMLREIGRKFFVEPLSKELFDTLKMVVELQKKFRTK